MSYMVSQVTDKIKWYQVDTDHDGIVSYPVGMFTPSDIASMHDVDVDDVETIEGYGARMSAPGYLDCTEWTVFDTKSEAEEYLEEYYGEEIEE